MAGLSRTWCVSSRLNVVGVLSAVQREADQKSDYCQLMPNQCCEPVFHSDSGNLLFFLVSLKPGTHSPNPKCIVRLG